MSERAVFDPEEIRALCAKSLPAGLRAIADAIEAGELQAPHWNVVPWGFVNPRDTRAHVILKVDLAAEVFRWQAGEKLPLPARKPLAIADGTGAV